MPSSTDDISFENFLKWTFARPTHGDPRYWMEDREFSTDYEKVLLFCIQLFEEPAKTLSVYSSKELQLGFGYMRSEAGYLRLIFEATVRSEDTRKIIDKFLSGQSANTNLSSSIREFAGVCRASKGWL